MTAMLDRPYRGVLATPSASLEAASEAGDIGLSQILAFIRRRRLPIIVSVLACLAAGLAYLAVTPAQYTAQTALLIDTRKLSIFDEGNVFEDSALSSAAVETQVQILRSSHIAEAVVTQLGPLAADPDLVGTPSTLGAIKSSISGFVKGLVGSKAAPGPAQPQLSPEEKAKRQAMAAIMANLKVARQGLSYVINVGFTARNPVLAADVANAVASAYLEDQIAGQFTTAERASNWLQSRIEDLRKQSNDPNLSVQERNAVRATYDNFLQRYTQAVQQQSLPVTEARVITEATPGQKSSPKTMLVLSGAILFGAVAGLGIALTRDLLDRAIRTTAQLEGATGVPCFGLLPTFGMSGRAMRRITKRAMKRTDPATQNFSAGAGHSIVLSAPASRFTETLRAVKIAVDTAPGGPVGVLGVISSLPNEGRTTVAINLARLAAQDGGDVLMIDGDLRNPTLSRSIVPDGTAGLVQAARGDGDIAGLVWNDQGTPLHFLPAGVDKVSVPTNSVLNSAGMANAFQTLRQRYNLIVVDLPPVIPVADVRGVAHLFDAFLFVAEWGFVTPDILGQIFHKGSVDAKVIGTVLNKADISKTRRFEDRPMPARYANL
jgi:Mrp family chromosome partitioning ATPase/capsular polysaccharide biosynthesis protein